jgi:hypothetical protein
MPVYTFMTERAGGTYISQVSAANLMALLPVFVDQEDARSGIPVADRKEFLIEAPVRVETTQTVWCASVRDEQDHHLLIHIIRTDAKGPEEGEGA